MRRSTFATACGAHLPPRAVPAAICRSVFAPAAWASRMAGATLSANASAPAEWFALAIVWVAAAMVKAVTRNAEPNTTHKWASVSNSAFASAISGNSGVGAKPSSAGPSTACPSASRPVAR